MIFFSFKMSDVLATTSFTTKVYNMMFQFLLKKKKMMCQFLTTIKNKTKQEVHKKFVYYLVHVILIIFITIVALAFFF